jgi:hypothetical protein
MSAVTSSRNLALLAGFVFGILVARLTMEPGNSAMADEKKPPEAFLSGGARSEKVLVEILTTLRQLDARVAGIEELMKKTETAQPAREAVLKPNKRPER